MLVIKKYELKETLVGLIDSLKNYSYEKGRSVTFGLNSTEEMIKLCNDLKRHGIVENALKPTRNDLTADYYVDKARDLYEKIM